MFSLQLVGWISMILTALMLQFESVVANGQINPTYHCTVNGIQITWKTSPGGWQETELRYDLAAAYTPPACWYGKKGMALFNPSLNDYYFWVGVAIAKDGTWTPCDGTATMYYVTNDDRGHWKHTSCSRA